MAARPQKENACSTRRDVCSLWPSQRCLTSALRRTMAPWRGLWAGRLCSPTVQVSTRRITMPVLMRHRATMSAAQYDESAPALKSRAGRTLDLPASWSCRAGWRLAAARSRVMAASLIRRPVSSSSSPESMRSSPTSWATTVRPEISGWLRYSGAIAGKVSTSCRVRDFGERPRCKPANEPGAFRGGRRWALGRSLAGPRRRLSAG